MSSSGPENILMAFRYFSFCGNRRDSWCKTSCQLLHKAAARSATFRLTSCGGPDRTQSGTPMSFRVKIIPGGKNAT